MRLICACLCLQVPQSLVFWGYHMVNAPTTWFGHSQAGRSQPPETAPAPVVFAPAQCPFVCKEPGKPNGLFPPCQLPDELLRLLFSLFLALPSSRPALFLLPLQAHLFPGVTTHENISSFTRDVTSLLCNENCPGVCRLADLFGHLPSRCLPWVEFLPCMHGKSL